MLAWLDFSSGVSDVGLVGLFKWGVRHWPGWTFPVGCQTLAWLDFSRGVSGSLMMESKKVTTVHSIM